VSTPKKLGHIGALGFDTVALPPTALTRRRDPNANEETHYDDIRVGSIAMRQGPKETTEDWRGIGGDRDSKFP
jgi:hypothetical protein